MHFTFSTTIASITGVTLLSNVTWHEVAASTSFPNKPFNSLDGSFKSHVKTQGAECSLVDAVKPQEIPDVGILSCGPGRTCVEDTTSSVGGRCEFPRDAQAHASMVQLGIPCNFENGTAGVKCYGELACVGTNDTQIGCGSCIGDLSCFYINENVTVGENSCVGKYSCALVTGSSELKNIGDNSCIGPRACKYVEGTIGNNSCNGVIVCKYLEGTVGSDSCIEGYFTCFGFYGGVIGDGSCSQYAACAQPALLNNTGNIGDSSCNGDWSCVFLYASRDTGDNSCNGDHACDIVTYNVGDNTCNGDYACPACYQSVQKVKLQSVTGAPIQIFEVKVHSSGVNVAVNKTATHSSTYKGIPKFGARSAVDGKENTFSHTDTNRKCSSWWEVDLGGLFPVESVHILNRWCRDESDPTACLCRLSHASLALFDDQGQCVESISLGDTCGNHEVKRNFTKSREYCISVGEQVP